MGKEFSRESPPWKVDSPPAGELLPGKNSHLLTCDLWGIVCGCLQENLDPHNMLVSN